MARESRSDLKIGKGTQEWGSRSGGGSGRAYRAHNEEASAQALQGIGSILLPDLMAKVVHTIPWFGSLKQGAWGRGSHNHHLPPLEDVCDNLPMHSEASLGSILPMSTKTIPDWDSCNQCKGPEIRPVQPDTSQ